MRACIPDFRRALLPQHSEYGCVRDGREGKSLYVPRNSDRPSSDTAFKSPADPTERGLPKKLLLPEAVFSKSRPEEDAMACRLRPEAVRPSKFRRSGADTSKMDARLGDWLSLGGKEKHGKQADEDSHSTGRNIHNPVRSSFLSSTQHVNGPKRRIEEFEGRQSIIISSTRETMSKKEQSVTCMLRGAARVVGLPDGRS